MGGLARGLYRPHAPPRAENLPTPAEQQQQLIRAEAFLTLVSLSGPGWESTAQGARTQRALGSHWLQGVWAEICSRQLPVSPIGTPGGVERAHCEVWLPSAGAPSLCLAVCACSWCCLHASGKGGRYPVNQSKRCARCKVPTYSDSTSSKGLGTPAERPAPPAASWASDRNLSGVQSEKCGGLHPRDNLTGPIWTNIGAASTFLHPDGSPPS